MISHIPNALTILRILLTFIAIGLLPFAPPKMYLYLLVIFVVAAITDFADGYVARRWGVVSDFGKVFDPLADKVLSFVFLVLLYGAGTVPGVIILLLIVRDLVIDSVRGVFTAHVTVVQAIFTAKLKTFFTFLFIIVALFGLSIGGGEELRYLTIGLAMFALILSYVSALQYAKIFYTAYKKFKSEKNKSSIM